MLMFSSSYCNYYSTQIVHCNYSRGQIGGTMVDIAYHTISSLPCFTCIGNYLLLNFSLTSCIVEPPTLTFRIASPLYMEDLTSIPHSSSLDPHRGSWPQQQASNKLIMRPQDIQILHVDDHIQVPILWWTYAVRLYTNNIASTQSTKKSPTI